MGCGCGGSTPQQQSVVGQQAPQRVEGGPGQPGYTWNGPQVPATAPPVAEPATAASE